MMGEVGKSDIGACAGLRVTWVVNGAARFNIDSGGATTIMNFMD
jgi:hypothetical protein